MLTNAEILGQSGHAFDFSKRGWGVKAAIAWPGLLARLGFPQVLSASYEKLDYSVPFTKEFMNISLSVETLGFAMMTYAALQPNLFTLQNTIDVSLGIFVGGAAVYGIGRAMSLGGEAGNRFVSQSRARNLAKLHEQTRSIFEQREQTINVGDNRMKIIQRTKEEFESLTGEKLSPNASLKQHFIDFAVLKHDAAGEYPLDVFAGMLNELIYEKDYLGDDPTQRHALHVMAVVGPLDRFRQVYADLGFEKKNVLEKGKEVWVLNHAQFFENHAGIWLYERNDGRMRG